MNGKVGESATFTSHWLLNQKQSTSDLYLMQWIIPKHISVCHCCWCFQHVTSTQYSQINQRHWSFSHLCMVTQPAPETLRAAVTGSYTNAKKRIWRCPTLACWVAFGFAMQLCHFNNSLLSKAWCSTFLPCHTAPDSPTEPYCLPKQAASQFRKLSFFLGFICLSWPSDRSEECQFWSTEENKHAAQGGNQNCPF